mgnify:CR=1 FL=1
MMNILHYSLGFPPFRRGGMTQYCLDLMIEQTKVGHQVGLLWPGRLYDLTPKSKVNQKQKYKLQNDLYCTSYELLNPLPIPLMDGIQDPAMYLIKKGIYRILSKTHISGASYSYVYGTSF